MSGQLKIGTHHIQDSLQIRPFSSFYPFLLLHFKVVVFIFFIRMHIFRFVKSISPGPISNVLDLCLYFFVLQRVGPDPQYRESVLDNITLIRSLAVLQPRVRDLYPVLVLRPKSKIYVFFRNIYWPK